MDKNILIRKAKLEDAKGIVELQAIGLKKNNWIYTGSNKPYSKEKINNLKKDLKSKSPESYSFVAVEKNNKKIIGSAMFSFRKTGRVRHRVSFGWGVHPDYQGKGIGTQLLKFALNFAKKKGYKIATAEAALENVGSIKLGKKLGFKIIGKVKNGLLTDDKRYIDTAIMIKGLK